MSVACLVTVVVFGSDPQLWLAGSPGSLALAGAAAASVAAVFATRALLDAGGLFVSDDGDVSDGSGEAHVAAHPVTRPGWASRVLSERTRGTLDQVASFVVGSFWAVRRALHVVTMRGTLLYAAAWAGTLALFVGVGVMVIRGDRLEIHPAWTILLLALWGLQRRNAMGECRR